jgi:DNA transposition AAA+ family ATPase
VAITLHQSFEATSNLLKETELTPQEIVAELGEAPLYRTSDLFRQVIEQLMLKPRSVFVDEIDYLTFDSRIIETLRDIHDITHVPIIFIGMGTADKRLMRFRHLWARFSEVVKFMPLTRQDVQSVVAQMCEVKLSSAAIDYLYQQTAGSFRSLIVYMHRAEYLGRLNNLEEIGPKDLKIRDLLC